MLVFEVEPFRFLSKPLNQKQLSRYFEEACERIGKTESCYQFTFNKQVKRVIIRDIIYFESRNRVIHIFLKDGTEEYFYGKLNDVESEFQEKRRQFLRIHQSFFVNFDYIKKMNFSSLVLTTCKGSEKTLKISEDRQKTVRAQVCRITGRKAGIE